MQPALLVSSTIGILLVMAAFGYLWQTNIHDDPNSLRSRIALINGTKSVVAAASALLRACLSVQVGTCCLMLATLAFEKNTVLLRDAAAMSIYRYATCSPWTMAFPVLGGTRVSRNIVPILLVVLLSSVAVLSQVVSTILLLDLTSAFVAGRVRDVPITYNPDSKLGTPDALEDGQFLDFPRFAERTGAEFWLRENSTGLGRAIHGTGRTLRAFVPLPQDQRSLLIHYDGLAGVVEANVLCTSPETMNVTYRQILRPGNMSPLGHVTGNLGVEFLHRSSAQLESQKSFRFNKKQSLSNLVLDLNCTIEEAPGLLDLSLYPLRVKATADCESDCTGFDDDLRTPRNHWFLFLQQNILRRLDTEYLLDANLTGPPEIIVFNQTNSRPRFNGSEWTTLEFIYPGSDVELELSLCVMPGRTASANITAQANATGTEPVYGTSNKLLSWTSWGAYAEKTAFIRRQFATSSSFEQRGILDLKIGTGNEEHLFSEPRGYWNDFLGTDHEMSKDPWYTGTGMNEVYQSIYMTTVYNASIMTALQTLFTLVQARSYYMYMTLDIPDSAETTISRVQLAQEAIIPQTKVGLFIVCAIVCLHFLSVILVFWLYSTCRTPTFLDQAWRTIGQLHNGDARAFLSESATLRDRDVGELPSAKEKWNTLVTIDIDGKSVSGVNCKSTGTDSSYAPLPGMSSDDRQCLVNRDANEAR
jgi:hypothetical protein